MASTTRSPMFSNNFFHSIDYDTYRAFPEPEPPAIPGPSLLDDQESSAFADFLEKVGSGGAVDASFLYDPKMTLFDPKLPDPTLWGWHDDNATATEYPFQPSITSSGTEPTSPHGGNQYISVQNGRRLPSDMSLDPYNPFGQRYVLENSKASEPLPPPELQEKKPNGIPSLAWGSDPHFNQTGYQNPGVVDPAKDVHVRVNAYLGPNPVPVADNTTFKPPMIKNESKNSMHDDDTEDESSRSNSADITPSPRNSISSTRKKSETTESGTTTKLHRKGRGRNSESSPKVSKKKNATKRENLSEAQKRENHIQSEQKRRNLIRTGFDDLCCLVPELRGGGYSKSAVLVHAANYLEQILEGNKELRLQVQQLESQFS